MTKILISAPIGGAKQYSINLWLEWIATQSYPKEDFDICLCTNGKGQKDLARKLKEIVIEYPNGYCLRPIIMSLPNNDMSVVQKITYSREMIRRFAVKAGYDYIFFLDSDTLPAFKDTIYRLLDRKKDVISGLYFYKGTKQPVIIDKDTNTNISLMLCRQLAAENKITEVWGFGFGCLLLSRAAFADNAFDYELFGEERTDDFGYCHVLEQKGIKRYFDPLILCKHVSDPDAKPSETGTRLPILFHNVNKD